MRAVVMREFGGPEVLRLEDVEIPEPPSGEVLLEVGAVTVNQTLDIGVRGASWCAGAPAHSRC